MATTAGIYFIAGHRHSSPSHVALLQAITTYPLKTHLLDQPWFCWLALGEDCSPMPFPPGTSTLAMVACVRCGLWKSEDQDCIGLSLVGFGNGWNRKDKRTIAGKKLSGALSPSIGKLTNLRKVYLQYNNISGSIPSGDLSIDDLVKLLAEKHNLLTLALKKLEEMQEIYKSREAEWQELMERTRL
ncbi:hypothetical protein L1049_011493 [Liquidambar formosana]|uniref:Uncharacterized protein n=1 Tax=Liquidambar formosana TaxID=63359 RepID=A0AAP0RRE2_LIQFO